ncbi:hypothetical protein RsTz2092_02180 [Deferribacterales bacterium RsTz2092]|nr:hypothetical protein AGMMS49941_12880 [Deferribacterales bacterium]
MNRFNIYVIRTFVKYIVISELILLAVTMLFELVDDYDADTTMLQLFTLEGIVIPNKIVSMFPVATLVAAVITVTLLMHSGELLGYVSLGGRIRQFFYPFALVSAVAFFVMIAYDYKIYPILKSAYYRYLREDIQHRTYLDGSKLFGLWLVDGNRLYRIGILDLLNKTMREVTEYQIDDTFRVQSIRDTAAIRQDGNIWVLEAVREVDMSGDVPKTTITDEIHERSLLFDDATNITDKRPKELSQLELYRMIRAMNSHGLKATKYEMALLAKYATASSTIVLLFVAVPLGINFSRRYSVTKGALTSLFGGMSYWAILATFKSFGTSAALPPILANFIPHILFITAGILMFKRQERSGT